MEQTMRRQEQLPGAFNGAINNSQHGRVRWYLVHTPNGKERETCEKVRRIIPHELGTVAKVQVFVEAYGDAPIRGAFCAIWENASSLLV